LCVKPKRIEFVIIFVKKNMFKFYFVSLISIACLLFSCSNNPYKRDVDSVNPTFIILPHQIHILELSKHYSAEKKQELATLYGPFFESYNVRIMKLPISSDTAYPRKLNELLNEDWIQELYSKTKEVFQDSLFVYKQLKPALQYYLYYFPKKQIPRFATFIGGVQYSVVIDSNLIAIGIDKYLGQNYDLYKDMEISSFVRRNMYKEKIAGDVMRAMAENEFPEPFSEQYLLAHMIQQGRYMYFVKCMLPETPDTVLWGYTARQLEFCEKSEGEFWKYFVSTDNTLFSSDYMTIKRFIDDGPFTPVFTKESPGKIGQWIGFRIVESFMKKNPTVTLEELFAIESAQEIMRKSKYNP